ncbi:hypothetical protein K432DRAFT_142947 [Lepidopterella palustris CBS 459.81]|uniref:Uncharacterized protein n=1 Tax=Lepidopterella palustris CBS 459.81 TaxID=1314670 RepID=A0A8E2JKS2_9PEZI|nr:hypothetical protein K432DRAFT_142947 [Lepidopterella palustris CBS 459.81]
MVGTVCTPYAVDENLVRGASRVLRRASRQPGTKHVVHLRDVEPHAFELYLAGIRGQMNEQKLASANDWITLVKAYILAEELDDSTFTFSTRCALAHKAALYKQGRDKFFGVGLIDHVYQHTKPDSELRDLLANMRDDDGQLDLFMSVEEFTRDGEKEKMRRQPADKTPDLAQEPKEVPIQIEKSEKSSEERHLIIVPMGKETFPKQIKPSEPYHIKESTQFAPCCPTELEAPNFVPIADLYNPCIRRTPQPKADALTPSSQYSHHWRSPLDAKQ